MRLSEQFLQLSVLALKLFQSLGVRHIHTAVLRSPLVETGVTEAVLGAQLLHRHASFRLPQKANDLLFCVFALSHVRHSPNLTDPLEISLVRYVGEQVSRMKDQCGLTQLSSTLRLSFCNALRDGSVH